MTRKKKLTRRERQVLALLRTGLAYKEIAHELGIAAGTASVHGANALRKAARTRLAVRAAAVSSLADIPLGRRLA